MHPAPIYYVVKMSDHKHLRNEIKGPNVSSIRQKHGCRFSSEELTSPKSGVGAVNYYLSSFVFDPVI